MKKLLLLLMLPASLWAYQQPGKPAPKNPKENGTIELVCKIIGMPGNVDSLTLYEPAGLAMRTLSRVGRQPDSSFVFTVPMSKPKFYAVGVSEISTARLILGEEAKVTLWANAQFMEKGRTVNSPANKAYEAVLKRTAQFQNASTQLRTDFASASMQNDKAGLKAAETRAAALQKSKVQYLDSLKNINKTLWMVGSLYVQPEYLADKSAAASEPEFLGKEYFRYANWTDKTYEDIPDVYNAFDAWTQYMASVVTSSDKLKQIIDAQLAKAIPGNKTHRMALGGVVNALKTAANINYPAYASQYVNAYRNQSMGEIGRLEFDLKRNSVSTPGSEAPDLVGPTPDGAQYSLKQMRGKYVLIDFWASWCGPCIREMPNVKENYEKYKDKGFDILGVSLDREANAWKNAIDKHGMAWKHISDLKGWSSEHAKLYSVTSIPQTLLIDKDGRIVARNLRGEQLGAKLKEVLGE